MSEDPIRVPCGSERVQSVSEGDRGSSQGVRESEGPVKGLGRLKVLSGSVEVRGPSQDLRDSEVSVRV